MAITTIEDKDGNVWTGREIEPSAAENITSMIAAVATLGISELMSPDTTTVEVNGERHTGERVGNK